MLQIAEHYDLGNEPSLAASYYLKSAQSTYYNGALKETSELCHRALAKIRTLPQGIADYGKMHAEIIQLLLLASRIWWHGKSASEQGQSKEESLIEEAEEAASRTGDKSLLARIKHLKGRIFVFTYNLEGAVQEMNEALQMARDTKDSLAEFFIMIDLGHQLVGKRSIDVNTTFEDGLNLQYSAYHLFENKLRYELKPGLVDDINQHLHKLQANIGIGEFDRGDYGKALEMLQKAIDGLEKSKMYEELYWARSYLGQVYIAIGLFEDAEKVLREAISFNQGEEGPSAVRGQSLAILGKLYLEWGHITDAEKPLSDGWKETQNVGMVAMVPVVRNYYAEMLMHPEYRNQNLAEAKELLKTTVDEVETITKFYRSGIIALSLLGKLALIEGDIDSAKKHSSRAVQYLEKMGIMPLVRMEEIFFNHYKILNTCGLQSEAKVYLIKAYHILRHKEESLLVKDHRETFLRVPISNAILSSVSI
jgi:tetratricopeptide (TPR) repeat protein